jgi:hypothetical protein
VTMKNFSLPRACQIVFVLAVTALAPRVLEAQSSIPFKATVSITESIQVVGAAPCFMVGNISGTGQASQLGKISIASTDCINPISETVFSFFSSDQLVITTASGEQIFATYSGTLTVQGQFGIINGGYLIGGGTGRYAQAAGAGIVNGQEDMLTGKGQVQLFGTIAY